MYNEELNAVMQAARSKTSFLRKNPVGYFVSSILAGAFIGFGILLIFTIGGLLHGQPYAKVVMGASFGVALSLVIISGSELFTGNNFVMAAGFLGKKVSLGNVIYLWIVCWIGNLVGSMLLALAFHGAGLDVGDVGKFIAATSAAKMSLPFLPLFLRGVLCNILVCVAVWCGFRCKSDSGKLIMIFWCLFAFITSGFEHSVANMTLLTISLLSPFGSAVSFSGFAYNLATVSLGNIVGGVLFVAVPYFLTARKKED